MRKLVLGVLFAFIFLTFNARAQMSPAHITSGNILLTNQFNPVNARLETGNFTAVSFLDMLFSPWENICPFSSPHCTLGKTITVPSRNTNIDLGGCVGDCNQFVRGTFTINGKTYKNAYFDGFLNFSQVDFFIPRVAQRKGFIRLKKPFSMSGRLLACRIAYGKMPCPADKILFEGDIAGKGSLTVTLEIRMYYYDTNSITYAAQKSFQYEFE